MSTKATILYDDGWHLYRECEDGSIHLHLDRPSEVDFECSTHHVQVRLPARVLRALLVGAEKVEKELKIADEDARGWREMEDEGEGDAPGEGGADLAG